MSGYKYPYIADKTMYAAVMGACKYIRETGYFHKAVSYYADKYGVDEDELERHIRARQAAGRKGGTSASKGKKYKWFLVASVVDSCEGSQRVVNKFEVVKGLSKESVEKKYTDYDFKRTMREDYGGYYAPHYYHWVAKEFEIEPSENEVRKAMEDYKKETEY